MACEHVEFEVNGEKGRAIVCRGRGKSRRCIVCRRAPATALCDAPLERPRYKRKSGSKTCDRPLCAGCAIHRDEDVDVCPEHKAWADSLADQGVLEGVL